MSNVCKWGGSSLASGARALNVANFIKANNLPYIVLSAPGKITALDTKITDLFIKITQNPHDIDNILEKIKSKYKDIINAFQIDFDIDKHLHKIKNQYLKSFDCSYLVSRGEYLIAKIFAKYLNYTFVDSKDIIKFDKNGKLLDSTYSLIKEKITKYHKVVIPGFYGSYRGKIKIFSRGGSDITGAIISKSLNVDYTNYTDVDGVYSTYPLNKSSKKLKNLSYSDMKFLGLFGFSVLHQKCCDILKNTNLKTYIKSTFEPLKRPTTLSNNQTKINARSVQDLVLIQASGDIYNDLLNKKIFVYFRYFYLNKCFYLISKSDSTKLENIKKQDVIVTAIVSNKYIANAYFLGDNHYLKIKKSK